MRGPKALNFIPIITTTLRFFTTFPLFRRPQSLGSLRTASVFAFSVRPRKFHQRFVHSETLGHWDSRVTVARAMSSLPTNPVDDNSSNDRLGTESKGNHQKIRAQQSLEKLNLASQSGLDPSTNRFHAPLVYHDGYSLVPNWPPNHTFPMMKFERTLHALLTTTSKTVETSGLPRPVLRRKEDLYRPPDFSKIPIEEWLDLLNDNSSGGEDVESGSTRNNTFGHRFLRRELTTEEARIIGFREQTHKPELVERTILEIAGTVLTAQLALKHGIASNLAGGTHHAHPKGGAGYTILNDLAITANLLTKSGIVDRVLVIDCDVHQGDGTAQYSTLWKNEGRLFTLSIHCESNYPFLKHNSTYDIGLPDHCNDQEYLVALKKSVDRAINEVRPDLVIYDAGVDVYKHDTLGRLDLEEDGIRQRDRWVLDRCVSSGIPIAAVVGGGYDKDIDALGRRHAIVHEECAYVWRKYKLWRGISGSAQDAESLIDNNEKNTNTNSNRLSLVALPTEWIDFDQKKDTTHAVSDLSRFLGVLDSSCETENDSQSSNFDTIINVEDLDPEDLMVALDLELVSEETQEPIKIRLNRKANELSSRAFQRLELTLVKKLTPKNKNKKRRKEAPGTGSNAEKPHSKLVVARRKDITTTIDNSNPSEIVTESLDTISLCRELLSLSECSNIALDVSIPLPCESNDNNEVSTPSSRTLSFELDSNLPTILATRTFESFTSKLFVGVPVTVQNTLLHATNVQVSWFLGDGTNVKEELVVRNSHVFVPKADHIGKSLTVVLRPMREIGTNKQYGRPEAYQFYNAIEELPQMPIVSPLRDEYSKGQSNDASSLLRVCTYNILADLYVSRQGTTDGETTYPHVKYEHVEKIRRIPLIMGELQAYDSHLICLQEVDGSVYDDYLQPTFMAMGYDGYYSNKASQQREGCAMFWSTKVFEKDQTLSFGIKDLFSPSQDGIFEREWKSMQGIRTLLESHKELNLVATEKLGQVVQIAKLKLKDPKEDQPKAIVVANTHLFWHPMADHIRAMQAFAVTKKIDEVRRQHCTIDHDSSPDPFLLCGDLNSDPLSGACQLLTTGSLESNQKDCWNYLDAYKWDVDDNNVWEMVDSGITAEARRSANRCNENKKTSSNVKPPSIELPDSFPTMLSGCQPNPTFTNFSLKFSETLDYVFASQPSKTHTFGFLPQQSAPMPSIQHVKDYISMPNEFMPSDHVSIVCDLKWCRWDSLSPE